MLTPEYNHRTLKADALKAVTSYYKAGKTGLGFCCWLPTASLLVSPAISS